MAHELLPRVNEPAILGASKELHSFDKEHLAESGGESKGHYLTKQGIIFTGFKSYRQKLIQIREISNQGRREHNYHITFKYRNKMLLFSVLSPRFFSTKAQYFIMR